VPRALRVIARQPAAGRYPQAAWRPGHLAL
jgi:hypothetical protein